MAAVLSDKSSTQNPDTSSDINMEPEAPLMFNSDLNDLIEKSNILLVGAGGIGCEVLKNLVLTGFKHIEIIDLDTIDVSNLNRQFLFTKRDVGKPKAVVARESVLKFNPNVNITAHHASVTSPEFGVGFIAKFKIVLNALDNRAARNHVNRLCLAAGVPLIESGTSGYLGQVELIKKKATPCYECTEKLPENRTFPGCTIRNTPSELIHCIVWAKHLFTQLFGPIDPSDEDHDVSPDPSDSAAGEGLITIDIPKQTTRQWAQEVGYAPDKLFTKLFEDDIKYLLSLKRLWVNRRPPSPLKWEHSVVVPENIIAEITSLQYQNSWTQHQCMAIFKKSLVDLKNSMKASGEGYLVWDKDDKPAMNFVAAAACLRALAFSINTKNLFQIKSMAGNIIPAIATSNAIVAGLVVLTALNALRGAWKKCGTVYLRNVPTPIGGTIIRETVLVPPNKNCAVCSDKPQVIIATDLTKMKCKEFEVDVLKNKLNMIAPDVQLDATGSVLISSEEGETDHNNEKTLRELGVFDGTILQADDFVQNYQLTIIAQQRTLERDGPPFIIVNDISKLKPKEEAMNNENGNKEEPSSSKNVDDELIFVENDEDKKEEEEQKKRKLEDVPVPVKKRKTEESSKSPDSDDEVTML